MIRILIVEEHELVRQALEDRLNHTRDLQIVDSTGNYSYAVQSARLNCPDVILLEIKGSAGIETLKALHNAKPQSAIIILTSYPDSKEEDQAKEEGATRYLLKTLNTASLVGEIRDVVQRQQGV
ncbi:MAG: response regulator transcription factor [Anaerolineae bacterium]|nr:response regulator transcription factor [Anaerolineae bacterium]